MSTDTASAPLLRPDMPMGDVMTALPGARRAMFARYHIGGCSSCAFHSGETLAELCARNENIPVQEMIDHLLSAHEQDLKMLISPAAAAAAVEAGTARLLDIRSREEHDAVKLKDAPLLTQDLIQQIMGGGKKDETLVFFDHKGARALDAASYFAGHGFTRALALDGGIDAWSREVDSKVPRYQIEMEDAGQQH